MWERESDLSARIGVWSRRRVIIVSQANLDRQMTTSEMSPPEVAAAGRLDQGIEHRSPITANPTARQPSLLIVN
jgi:hypothetical protein